MLKRIKCKTWKPLALWKKANVLISKQDYNWFKITVFIKNWPTINSDWLSIPMDCEDKLEYRDKLIIEEVNDILDTYQDLED